MPGVQNKKERTAKKIIDLGEILLMILNFFFLYVIVKYKKKKNVLTKSLITSSFIHTYMHVHIQDN